MVDGQLEDLGLLQLRRALLLEGGRYQAPQFVQRVVDPVTAALLDDHLAMVSLLLGRMRKWKEVKGRN